MHLPPYRAPITAWTAGCALLALVACGGDSSPDSPDPDADALGSGDASTATGGQGTERTASGFGNAEPPEGLQEPACDCDGALVSLECLCMIAPCPDLDAELAAFCEAGADGDPRITIGCGIIRSEHGSDGSFSQRVLVYDAENLKLIAGSTRDDVQHGGCNRFSYTTAMPATLTSCEALQDFDGCSQCPGDDDAGAAPCSELP